ncbi:MAG: ABC transporter substrate-binding protein [Deltaproteobacteria bacterium]|nr:ABC transporter substrate-binding protein [Deltaproteobacteria bacterium]
MRAALIAAFVAVAAAQTATEAIQKRDEEIRAALPPAGQEPTAAQKEKAEDLLTKFIDFQGMAKAALGSQWDKMSPKKQKELLDAFTKRLKQASSSQLDFYRSTEIKYDAESGNGGDVSVPTSMVVKGEPTHVTYVMRQGKGGWMIEDIVIDDLSTVETYRGQFQKVINKEGVDGLIARLKKAPEEKPAGKPAATDPAPAPATK